MNHRLSWLSLLPLPLLLWGMPGLAIELEQELVERRHAEVFFEAAQPLLIIDGNEMLSKQTKPNADSASSRQAEANCLLNEGIDKYNRSEWRAALTTWQQALEIYQAIGDRAGEATTLYNIGIVNRTLGNYLTALNYYQKSLLIAREISNRASEANNLSNIGELHRIMGSYLLALDYHQQSLVIFREMTDREGETLTLHRIGNVNEALGNYPMALDYHQQSLVISREIGYRGGEGIILSGIGNVYLALGSYPIALDYYQQSLDIKRETGDRAGEAEILNGIGNAVQALGAYITALNYYQQSLLIRREIGYRGGEAQNLNNIGIVYKLLGNYPEALEFYQQSLAITRDIGDRTAEATTLNNIGVIYKELGEYPEAIAQYEQSLAITREIGDRAGEANTLGNMGFLFEAQDDPVLAIIFLKQAINIYEAIRDGNQALAQELQDSYTATIADDYRTLADLLLQQNRILEAQRVLDLLRVQELDDYLRGVQRNATTEAGVAYWRVEDNLLRLYRELLLAGDELALLQDIPFSELTPEQQQRLADLTARQGELLENFQQWLEHPEVAATLTALRTSTEGRNLEIEDYATLQQNLANLPQNTVLLYPLILDQRLELVLVTPHAPPVRHPVNVEAVELNRVIAEFGRSLKYARPDIDTHAQQLYDWLIKPLEDNLSAAQVEMIIFAPDGALRYVPLAALHDGDGWLTERFSFTHITAAALTNFAAKPQANPRLLAAACGQCDFEYDVAGQQFRFSLLPYAESEVALLAQQMPNVDVLPTADFTPEALNLRLGSYEILHLATHGAFVSGQPEESFIVFGDESRVNLSDIERQWKLPNADLVVLSACETAVGSDELGTGVEILGLGFQIQQAGAKATLASLWPVSDGGTQVLMNAFYSALAAGKTKAEALQLAQQALLTGNGEAAGLPRGGFVLADIPEEVVNNLAHPHYWAPFILIGNGL